MILRSLIILLPLLASSFHLKPTRHSNSHLSAYESPFLTPTSSTPSPSAFKMLNALSPFSSHALSPLKDVNFFLKTPYSSSGWKTLEGTPNPPRPTSATRGRAYSVETLPGYVPTSQLLRFRARMSGFVDALKFSSLLTTSEHRKRWDATVDDVYKVSDFDFVPPLPGVVAECGVGYCRTRKALAGLVSPREQLTLCGVQEGVGGAVIWAFELPGGYTDGAGLWPTEGRLTRASTDIFCASLIQREGCFEVEYLLSLDVGGGVPRWATTPVIVQR